MAIQMRRGDYKKFNPSKLLPAEFAIVQENDPVGANGQSVYIATNVGEVKRLATYEDVETDVFNAIEQSQKTIIDNLTNEVTTTNNEVKTAEAERVEAEKTRVSNENDRIAAEKERVEDQTKNNTDQEANNTDQQKNNADQAANNAAATGFTYYICSAGEYELDADSKYNKPTISNPKIGTVYLTPKVTQETDNKYDQWLYVDGAWELIAEGSSTHVEPVTTDEIDNITSGYTVTNESHYLNSTGLSYYNTKSWESLYNGFNLAYAPINHASAMGEYGVANLIEYGHVNLDMIYPVGAVYLSYESTSPAALFGGSWTQLTNVFLRAANDTSTGGSDTHKLTVNEMPVHAHTQLNNGAVVCVDATLGSVKDMGIEGGGYWKSASSYLAAQRATNSNGGGQSHNNMPAYQDLYAWRRTA